MKKLLSIVLAVAMIFAVSATTTVAMAATVGSQETTVSKVTITIQVNGSESKDATYEKDPSDENKITFTYNGTGDVTWDFGDLVEGVDYEIISEDGNSITIELINGYNGEVIANAVVDTEDDETTTVKSSDKSTSPNTGAVAAAGIAVAGAGAAILAAIKKNDAE